MGSPVSLCDARRLVIGKSNGDLSSRETTEEDDDSAVFSGEEEEEGWREDGFCYYFVKQFPYDDPEIKAKIDEADNEIYNCNTERIHIANSLKAKRAERLSLMSSLDDGYNVMKDQETNSLSEIKMEMELLDAQMGRVLDQRDRAVERIKFLRIQRDKGNAAFFQSRVVMKKAIELAACGNVRDLEELANSEVDKFMSRWNKDKAFRDDYKKRIFPSLEERNERIRSSEGDVDAENRDDRKAIELKRFSGEEEEEVSDEKEEEETLKEKKREEQLEKARLAMERKRKRHEKAAAKAAIRVKKEAEKKLKELEKRATKKKTKASSPSDLERTPETVTEGSEPENIEKEKPLNGRSMSWNKGSLRYRHHKKGNETVPKAILKRKRAYRLWVWSVYSAAISLALTLLLVFFYVR